MKTFLYFIYKSQLSYEEKVKNSSKDLFWRTHYRVGNIYVLNIRADSLCPQTVLLSYGYELAVRLSRQC